ncbi:MAG: ETC complex I subunit [Alphaproteobacteria bacterium]
MDVRIYRPAKTAMQSGLANTRAWVLEFEPTAPKVVDPLMGWAGSPDTRQQVRLRFSTKEEAVAFARKHGLAYRVFAPSERKARPKAYADNFRYHRPG